MLSIACFIPRAVVCVPQLWALKPHAFFTDLFHVFDLAVVIANVVRFQNRLIPCFLIPIAPSPDLAPSRNNAQIENLAHGTTIFAAFRAFLLLQLFRMGGLPRL